MEAVSGTYQHGARWDVSFSTPRSFPEDLRTILDQTPPYESIVRIFSIAEKYINNESRIPFLIEYLSTAHGTAPTLHKQNANLTGPVRWQCSSKGDLYIIFKIRSLNDPDRIYSQAFYYRPDGPSFCWHNQTHSCMENSEPFCLYTNSSMVVEDNLRTIFRREGDVYSKGVSWCFYLNEIYNGPRF